MTISNSLDDKTLAELLCYLVVGQLVVRARTGDWLRSEQREELLHIWFRGNAAEVGWVESARLIALSEKIAMHFAELPNFADAGWLATQFKDTWRMDYRSPNIWHIHAACENAVKAG